MSCTPGQTHVNGRSRLRILAIIVTALLIAAFLVLVFGRRLPVALGVAKSVVADRLLVEKASRKLSVFAQGREIRSYRIALGRQPIGRKEQEGDMKTPEGFYTIDYRNPHSDFHLALHVSYPQPDDAAQATARGVSPGGDIMIHGLPNGMGWMGKLHRDEDWTAGCIALTNEEIEELWRLVPDGTPIEIRP